MTVEINYRTIHSLFEPLSGCENYLIIGDSTENHFADFNWEQIGVFGEINTNLANLCAKRLKPNRDNVAIESFMTMEGCRVCLGILPTACARHNTPSKSHGVTTIVENANLRGKSAIVLRPSKIDHVFAQTVAASRPFPLYSRKTYKNNVPDEPKETETESLEIILDHKGVCEEEMSRISDCVRGVRLCQSLVDSPPNELHTDAYVDICKEKVKDLDNVTFNVIQGQELEERGFGGLWGVGKASEHKPALVILSYYPPQISKDVESICMVGKGIVYDTGGLSLKSKDGMPNMKTDMGGSAAVLGAFLALAKQPELTRPVHALLCISENSCGMYSTRPDDIHTFLSGKTVEINNTDAEGRLVLADGCFYAASTLNPKVIVDIATLTGAQGIATGKRHAAIYCSDEGLENDLVDVGKISGDLTHPLPYCPEFFRKEFASKVADMKNSVASRSNAQSSCAGQFIANHIENYIENGGRWAHIDMAAPSSVNGRATGYGVALLIKFTEKFMKLN